MLLNFFLYRSGQQRRNVLDVYGDTPCVCIAPNTFGVIAVHSHNSKRMEGVYPSPRILAEIRCEQDLQEAVTTRALFVVYQPIFRLSTGEMIGAEALVRWDHPTRGILMPDEFIPFAEASGMIVPIGEFVLEQVCGQLLAWQASQMQHLLMSVNVSAVQLAQGNFARVVKECLADYGVPADRLQLEITETAPFDNEPAAIRQLCELKRLGVRIVLDDFGRGYMSLSHLVALEVDGVKIDRCFTRSLPDSAKAVAVVTSMIRLAARLSLSVVVEGVETEIQARWLRRFSDIGVQGFLYARPLVITGDFETLRQDTITRPAIR